LWDRIGANIYINPQRCIKKEENKSKKVGIFHVFSSKVFLIARNREQYNNVEELKTTVYILPTSIHFKFSSLSFSLFPPCSFSF
jgi:hypothetical protein